MFSEGTFLYRKRDAIFTLENRFYKRSGTYGALFEGFFEKISTNNFSVKERRKDGKTWDLKNRQFRSTI